MKHGDGELSMKTEDEITTRKWKKRISHEEKLPFIPSDESTKALTQTAAKRWYTVDKKQSIPTKAKIKKILESFVAREEFTLTPFSAKKIEGKKLYEYAREWNPIMKQSQMNLISCELVEYTFPHVQVRFHVWSGTYIRSLGFELGKALWWGGILVELKRESIGEYSLD